MSDSELSEAPATPVPPDAQLEQSLRREVYKAQAADEEFTINSIRAASETSLGLTKGFYLNSAEWKDRSKEIIRSQNESDVPIPKSPEISRTKKTRKPPPKKRVSVDVEDKPRKTQNRVTESESESELSSPNIDSSEHEYGEPQKEESNKSKVASKKSKESKDVGKGDSEEDDNDGDGSGSEMSVVLDDAPPKKKPVKNKPSKKSNPPKPATDDPDQAEIRRLQGWLVKCGIRKLWGKELKPYETPKAKIKHLKEMLADVGMTGRYSQEKATSIREARELAADIEAVQEGAERWGAEENEEGEEAERPRRLVRGAKNYDFLSSDGEETD